eukprot:gene2061-2381_t
MRPGQGWGQYSQQLVAKDVHIVACYKRPHRVTRPQAVASHLATDDTAEARRRLARQFRRHKLESQPAGSASQSIQGLQPRPLQQGPPANGQPPLQLSSTTSPIELDALISQLPPAGLTADAAARELLERQYQLWPHGVMQPAGGIVSDVDLQQSHLTAALLLPSMESTAKQLTKAIMQATDWRQVQVLLQEHEPQVNTTHLCASIVCLSKLRHIEQPGRSSTDLAAFLQQLVTRVVLAKDGLVYRQACNVLWAVAKLPAALRPETELLAELYQYAMVLGSGSSQSNQTDHSSDSNLSSWDSQSVANTLWSLATLGQRPPVKWLNRMLHQVESAAAYMTVQGLSMTLWGLAALGVVPQASCMVALLQSSAKQLQHFTPQGLSNVLWALAVLEHVPSKLWVSQFWQVSRDMLPFMTTQGLINCLWASAKLRVQPPQEWIGDISRLLLQQGVQGLSAQGLSNEVSLPLLTSAGPFELATMFHSQISMSDAFTAPAGSSLSKPAVARKWVDAWLAAAQSCFNSASSRDLAQWLWCLGKRGVRPPAQWWASFQVASFRQMAQASSQDLANMLWALGSLGMAPDPAWLQQALHEATRRQYQRQLLPQHLANIGWSLAKLGHRPDRSWLVRYQEDVFSSLSSFKPQELTNVLWSLAQLNCKIEQGLLDECLAYMTMRLPSYKANEVAVSLWAVARLKGQPHPRLMGEALQHCFSQARQLTPTGLSMLMWSVGNSATTPPNSWVAKLLIATGARMPGFSAQELSMLAVSLARIEYRPPDVWLQCFAAAAQSQMKSFGAQ